jgi:hypothetical protein
LRIAEVHANAKKAKAEEFHERSGTNDPTFAERHAARSAIGVACDVLTPERTTSRLAGVARQAAAKACELGHA